MQAGVPGTRANSGGKVERNMSLGPEDCSLETLPPHAAERKKWTPQESQRRRSMGGGREAGAVWNHRGTWRSVKKEKNMSACLMHPGG